jgi:hypothetical protein
LTDGDQPITNANGLIYQNLILSGTGNKTAPPDDLIIQGNLSKTGSCTFIHNDGTVIFRGINAQSYTATFPQMMFNNLINENTTALNINGDFAVCKKLALAVNSKTNLNADITLKSDKNRTANVAKTPANATINYTTGLVVVERFINSGIVPGSHGKSWQLLSTPAFGGTIYNTWQENGDNAINNFGTWITDPLGTTYGFDATSISPSIKTFNSSIQTWQSIGSTNISVANPNGYFVYVRGDRTVRIAAAAPTSTTLKIRGKLFTGDQPPLNVAANSYQSIGNPYASVVDFSKLITSNVDNSFYVWDPSIAGNYSAGGYQTISASTGFIAVPGASSIYPSNADYRNIQSGQAFMVHNATSSNGFVQFTEDCKMDDAHHLVNREGASRQMFFANLYTQDGLIADGNAVVFDEDFSNNIDGDDATKMLNSGENFSIKRNNNNLAIEARQPVSRPDTIFYDLRNLKQQEYRMIFIPKNISTELSVFFTDRFLNIETELSVSDSSWISFSITSDPGSSAADRFIVSFRPTIEARQLLVSFISVNAYQKNKNVFVEWEVENEDNVHHYEVEHSTDSAQFIIRENKNPLSLSDQINSYIDESPSSGNNFYRIRVIDKNGKSVISPVVKILFVKYKSSISVYPNPMKGETIYLIFRNQSGGNYQLNLYDASGVLIQKKMLFHSDGTEHHDFNLNKNLPKGIYLLEIIRPEGLKKFLKVVK